MPGVRVSPLGPKMQERFVPRLHFFIQRETRSSVVTCRWQVTAPARMLARSMICAARGTNANESPHSDHIRTKVMIPKVLQLSFFLSKQALFLTISKNNSILFMMSLSHRRLRSVSSGERGARHCAELWCGTATVDIVPP